MKRKSGVMFKRLSLFAFFVGYRIVCIAQPPAGGPPAGGGGSVGTTPPCWDPPCIPIDGGLVFLIVAGVILGVSALYQSRRKTV